MECHSLRNTNEIFIFNTSPWFSIILSKISAQLFLLPHWKKFSLLFIYLPLKFIKVNLNWTQNSTNTKFSTMKFKNNIAQDWKAYTTFFWKVSNSFSVEIETLPRSQPKLTKQFLLKCLTVNVCQSYRKDVIFIK